jgi:hypothetical protein
MPTVIQQVEAAPAKFNGRPPRQTVGDALDRFGKVAWQRIEPWIAWRFSPRTVTWIVQGPGDWRPPLTPAVIDTVEVWNGDAWEATTLSPSALGGYALPGCGPYRFTATVGTPATTAPPDIVQDAVKRLAEYLAAEPSVHPGATSERESDEGLGETAIERSPSWVARAMQNSGAADLLRNYRRAP